MTVMYRLVNVQSDIRTDEYLIYWYDI